MAKNYWIFVINKPDEEFKRRIKRKLWPIYNYTLNRKKIQPNDEVVFYKAGVGDKSLLGTAETTSAIKVEEGKINFMLELRNITVWKKPMLMKPFVNELDFIHNKDHWGRYLLGGVIHISEKDYITIVTKSKEHIMSSNKQ